MGIVDDRVALFSERDALEIGFRKHGGKIHFEHGVDVEGIVFVLFLGIEFDIVDDRAGMRLDDDAVKSESVQHDKLTGTNGDPL